MLIGELKEHYLPNGVGRGLPSRIPPPPHKPNILQWQPNLVMSLMTTYRTYRILMKQKLESAQLLGCSW